MSGQNLPDNPDPVKCYVKCITKDEFSTLEETVTVPYTKKAGRTDLAFIPATFGTDAETFEIYPETSG